MATQSKAKFLTDVYTLLKRRYKPKPDRGGVRLSILKAVVYGICHEATSREQADALIAPVAAQLRERIGSGYFGDDDTTLAGAIVARLAERGLTLGTAESCTGGAVADAGRYKPS